MQYAPIALFTYNRADKTQRVVESLLTNAEAKESDLFVFSDGPKNEKAAPGVKANREYLKSLTSNALTSNLFKSITIVEREKNWGLANSLIAGITEVINKYGKVIVVEDDLILSPYFLKFMNEGLDKYKGVEKIGTISAYVPPIAEPLPETFFLLYFQCWGWATWKRAWDLFERDPKPLLRKLRFKKNKFNVGDSIGNYENLYCYKVGLVDSWYLRFYASLFLEKKLTLYPGCTLASNNGLDGTGIHCKARMHKRFDNKPSNQLIKVLDIPIREDLKIYQMFKEYFLKNTKQDSHPYYNRVKSFIRRLLYIDCL